MSIQKPGAAKEFLENAELIAAKVKAGQKQKDIAHELGIREAMVSNYLKVTKRWPTEALRIIKDNAPLFPPRKLTSLSNQNFSDLRGGEPLRKSTKPSLVATLRAILDGKPPRPAKRDPERLLAQERSRSQELRQRVRELQRQPSSETILPRVSLCSPDQEYLGGLLIQKYSARVELNPAKSLITIHCGNSEHFDTVIGMLLGPAFGKQKISAER